MECRLHEDRTIRVDVLDLNKFSQFKYLDSLRYSQWRYASRCPGMSHWCVVKMTLSYWSAL